MRWSLLVMVGAGCAARGPRIPGPLASVGRAQAAIPPGLADDVPTADTAPSRRAGLPDQISAAAAHYLDHRPRGFRDDCSGFVMAVFDRVGIPLDGSTAQFYDLAKASGALHHKKEPRPGDLAFFDNTYDRDHNGRTDDALSHVAVVLEVRSDGTILLAHAGTSQGRATLTMNLHHPGERSGGDGAVLNDWLRQRRDNDPPGTRYLAGELWRAFGRVDADGFASP